MNASVIAFASSSYFAASGTVTVNGPGWSVATFASGGSAAPGVSTEHGRVTEGAITSAGAFSPAEIARGVVLELGSRMVLLLTR